MPNWILDLENLENLRESRIDIRELFNEELSWIIRRQVEEEIHQLLLGVENE